MESRIEIYEILIRIYKGISAPKDYSLEIIALQTIKKL